jgi:hypothetical protein
MNNLPNLSERTKGLANLGFVAGALYGISRNSTGWYNVGYGLIGSLAGVVVGRLLQKK